jgi:hypothetical protein
MHCGAYPENQMNVPKTPEEIEQRGLNDRLDEALDESFPASDPPAVHPHYAGRGGKSSTVPSGTKGTAMTRVEFEGSTISIDAALVAAELGTTPELVLAHIREGKITSGCEHGRGDDAGRFRLTFVHGNRVVRIIVDEEGNVLERTTSISTQMDD